jgi:hypothetical protein
VSIQPDLDRLGFLVGVVEREGRHLLATRHRLLSEPVTPSWVEALANDVNRAERVDAFVARFARMQDTIGERLVPELRRHMLETPGAALDNLNRMEKLGLLVSVTDWVEARNLRNALIHEYMQDTSAFADALNRSRERVSLLVQTYNALHDYARARWPEAVQPWPPTLPDPQSTA